MPQAPSKVGAGMRVAEVAGLNGSHPSTTNLFLRQSSTDQRHPQLRLPQPKGDARAPNLQLRITFFIRWVRFFVVVNSHR